jgi:hypothetical protein
MAEVLSKQATRAATAGSTGYNKRTPADQGRMTVFVLTSPDVVTWTNGDTVAGGVPIPIGTRFLNGASVVCTAMGTSVVMDVGIRNFDTKTAIDADGISASVNVAAAGSKNANGGALVGAGVEYVTTEVSELYVTLSGATPTANAQFRLEVPVILAG